MRHFRKESVIHAPAKRVFDFHALPDTFHRLQPPWQQSEIIQPPVSLQIGTRVILRVKFGPFWQTIEAEHVEYEPGHLFADRMVRGPFASWLHRHIVEPRARNECVLIDDVTYALPFSFVGSFFGGWFAGRELQKLFAYRHDVTRAACEQPDESPN